MPFKNEAMQGSVFMQFRISILIEVIICFKTFFIKISDFLNLHYKLLTISSFFSFITIFELKIQ